MGFERHEHEVIAAGLQSQFSVRGDFKVIDRFHPLDLDALHGLVRSFHRHAHCGKRGAAAKEAQAAELKAENSKAEQYRSQYPGNLHFDYVWDQKKGRALGLVQIWRDDKFTYLRGQFQETPALYEVKDKKPSLINFDYNGGLYTVPKELDGGYLAIGKQKVEFHRTGERN